MTALFKGLRPDITPAQLVGLLVAGVPIVANLLRAFGLYDLTAEQQQALQDTLTWGAVLAGALFVSDAGLRSARNIASANGDTAAGAPTPAPVPEPQTAPTQAGGAPRGFVGPAGQAR